MAMAWHYSSILCVRQDIQDSISGFASINIPDSDHLYLLFFVFWEFFSFSFETRGFFDDCHFHTWKCISVMIGYFIVILD